SIHHGTHLEGNELTLEQTERLVKLPSNGSTTSPSEEEARQVAERVGVFAKQRDIQEVLNYRTVLEWIDEQEVPASGRPTYVPATLKELHQRIVALLLPVDHVGSYRKQQVVVRSVDTGEIVFRPPF